MKLFKDKDEKLWVELFGDGNLIDFAGHSYKRNCSFTVFCMGNAKNSSF